MDQPNLNQAEVPQISSSLDLETLDTNLFRSRYLWLPTNARGVFGGQVISQAIVAATNCVNPSYSLHSLHCYFVLNASPAVPIYYHVDRIRDGRSYATRTVRAVQNGRVIFVQLCSFQKPEPWQPFRRPSMPNVPSPEACEDEDVMCLRFAAQEGINQSRKELLIARADERTRSPIAVKKVSNHTQDEIYFSTFWMRAKNIPSEKREAAYQKCVLGYMSDIHFIGAAARALGLKSAESENDDQSVLGLVSTLDHAIWFYDDDFDCGDWILYEMRAPQVGSGRGLVLGRMFTRQGVLIAQVSQEGVVRSRARGPNTNKGKL